MDGLRAIQRVAYNIGCLFIHELLESIRIELPDRHQGAIDDINKVLARDNLWIRYVNGQYKFSRIGEANRIVELTELGQCLEDFVSYISTDMRMSFWHFNNSEKKVTAQACQASISAYSGIRC